jgi:MFS family permease
MYWRLLRTNRDFRFLYIATLISLGGDWFLTVALLDLVLQLTGSATLASLMLLCQTLPIFLVTPIAGHTIDRLDRRKVMIVVDVVRIGACLLPLLARTPETLPFAYLGVILISVGSAYFEPASHASLPNIVSAEELAPANVLMGSTWGMMLAVGAGLGGLFTMRFGSNASFIVDSISFAFSAFLLWRMRGRFSEVRGAHHVQPPFFQSLRETFAYARTHPRVLALLSCKTGYGTGAGVVAMLSVYGKEVFGRGAAGIGLLYAARGLGALCGPFLVRAIAKNDDARYRSIVFCVVAFGLGYTTLGLSRSIAVGAAAIFFAHLGGGAAWQISTYGLQRETPDHIRGRVFSADFVFVTLTMAISSVIAGAISDRYSPLIGTVTVASICTLFGVIWGVWTWKLWKVE